MVTMVERLTQEERQNLLTLLACLIEADKASEPVMRAALMQYARYLGVDPSWIRCEGLETPASRITRPEAKVLVLAELMRLGRMDGNFSIAEISVILEVASLLKVPMHMLEKIECWVLKGIEWILEGNALLEQSRELLVLPE
ncbi:MAG TPA: hypothetical protein PLX03_07935 [Candidatus Hydrogenedentes bacterium]|nr:hypothetical protein [Candidatus Hydrogenedentota bacterium]